MKNCAKRMLLLSWYDIDYNYNDLTDIEQATITEAEFYELLKECMPTIGCTVTSRKRITEGGWGVKGDPSAVFPDEHYIHADPGEVGTLENLDGPSKDPVVRWKRTGTSTIVSFSEIEW